MFLQGTMQFLMYEKKRNFLFPFSGQQGGCWKISCNFVHSKWIFNLLISFVVVKILCFISLFLSAITSTPKGFASGLNFP